VKDTSSSDVSATEQKPVVVFLNTVLIQIEIFLLLTP
jgi:hypothetical protein